MVNRVVEHPNNATVDDPDEGREKERGEEGKDNRGGVKGRSSPKFKEPTPCGMGKCKVSY